MAIAYLKNIASGSEETSEHGDVKRSYTKTYQIIADSVNDGPAKILNTVGLPRPFDYYSHSDGTFDLNCRCLSRSPNREGSNNSRVWYVDCTYQTLPQEQQENEDSDPTYELPEVSMDVEAVEEYTGGGYDDSQGSLSETFTTAFRNSAGESLKNVPPREGSKVILRISKNVDVNAPIITQSRMFQSKLNESEFWDCPPKTVKCTGISARLASRDRGDGGPPRPYLRAQYTFEIKDSWAWQPLDSGSYYINTGSVKHAFVTPEGVSYEGLLDGDGDELQEGEEPHYLGPWFFFATADFGALNLPQSFAEVRPMRV